MLNRPRDVIIVTGAGGFLGSRVVSLVRRRAPRARVIAVFRRKRAAGRPVRGVEAVYGDLRSGRVWRRLPADVTRVIHLAASIPRRPRDGSPARVFLDNVAPVARLLHASRAWPRLRQIVYGSSVSVYTPGRRRFRESSPTRPISAYGAAKLAGERLLGALLDRGIAVASLRFSSLYGPGQQTQTVLPLFADRARRRLPLEVFDANRVQDFVHVDDAARATWLACACRASGPFNIGSGCSVTMSRLAREILRAFDANGATPIVDRRPAATGDHGTRMDIGRARRRLGYRPRVPLAAGLSRLARERGA